MSVAKCSLLLLSIGGILLSASAGPANPQHHGKRLIKTSPTEPAVWMSPEEIGKMVVSASQEPPEFDCPFERKSFMDITSNPESSSKPTPPNTSAVPTAPRYPSEVNRLLPLGNRTIVEEVIRHLSQDYHTRYFQSEEGAAAEQWLLSQVESILASYRGGSSTYEWEHGSKQKSLTASLTGEDPALRDESVILGAHIDSATWEDFITFPDWNNGSAPGADDDASGAAILLETLRILVEGGFRPKRTIEFHWYTASEIGLAGSGEVAVLYSYVNKAVAAMIQFDRAGYQGANVSDIGIYTDGLDNSPQVAQLARKLTEEYLDFGWRDSECGYGFCSDHAAWAYNAYPALLVGSASFPSNDVGCRYHWTSNDTIQHISMNQVMEMVKIGVSLAVEIAEPMANNTTN